ncbi:hypothetical protein G6M26_23385 [Agrobacterium tumefaciens]|nr:hypothetical protein [Agrobacterium tumefaciens]NTE21487.1 hypothetical protein [Agrobacterium tumefaciens]
MDIKAANGRKQIKIGGDLITIEGVKGDSKLFRVMVNNTFSGYLQFRDGHYYRLDGSGIHDLIFAKICQCLENDTCT